MFRLMKSVGVAMLCAVTASVAIPGGAGGAAHAATTLDVYLTYEGDEFPNPFLAVAIGSEVTLGAEVAGSQQSLQYEWTVEGTTVTDLTGPTVTMECDWNSFLEVDLTVTNAAGDQGVAGGVVVCSPAPTAEFSPGEPNKRQLIVQGAKLEFSTFSTYPVYSEYEWRTTGVPGVAGTGEYFTRTFDKVGNIGVELTQTNSLGRGKYWVGYTVIGPPVASIKPAAAKPTARLKVAKGSTITFDGSGSQSPGGGSLKYKWVTTGSTAVAGTGRRFSRRFDQAGNFGVELTVTNVFGQTSKRWVGVTVAESAAPVVSVTPAPAGLRDRMTVTKGSRIVFDGSRSMDPDGGTLSYYWRTTGQNGVVSNANRYRRTFDKVGDYGVELTVIDDEGQQAKRWVGLRVVP